MVLTEFKPERCHVIECSGCASKDTTIKELVEALGDCIDILTSYSLINSDRERAVKAEGLLAKHKEV